MCESNAYLVKNGQEEVVMESVDILRPEADGIYLENMFGEHLKLSAHVKEMHLVDHRILLVKEGEGAASMPEAKEKRKDEP